MGISPSTLISPTPTTTVVLSRSSEDGLDCGSSNGTSTPVVMWRPHYVPVHRSPSRQDSPPRYDPDDEEEKTDLVEEFFSYIFAHFS